jgi:choline-sulfatase
LITRKEFLKLLSTSVAMQAANVQAASRPGSVFPAGQERAEAQNEGSQVRGSRPNVLIIMTDQHRKNYMTAAGNSIVPTPNIDRIAQRGVRFTNAVCPYPVCAASRMALLTGKYPHTTGVINNTDLLPWNAQTVASHFGGHGYHTGLIGKMHFNDGHMHGFQYFLGFNDWFMYLGPKVQHYADEIANNVEPVFFNTVNDDGAGLPEKFGVWGDKLPWAGHVERMGLASAFTDHEDEFDAFVARESCKFLEKYAAEKEPFFLVSSFLRPHPPLHPPHPWTDKYPLDATNLPEKGDISQYPKWIQRRIAHYDSLGVERLKSHRAGYLGNLDYVDTCVGTLYGTLEKLGLLNNTIVIYTSDHGEMDGDHGLFDKFCLFDPSVGVPLIASFPGHIPEGKVSEALVEYFSLFPTLAELAGLPAPQKIDARSFANLVRNPAASGPDAVFSEYNLRTQIDSYMVRTHKYKYNYNHGDIGELYDLEADPGEKVNQIHNASLVKVRSEMHDRLMVWYDPAKNPYRAGNARGADAEQRHCATCW